ncbi:MAG: leucyl/phenylalanyl-tRNA--protein transferase [Muribaculaceae bacterium]|nr:leucyl/phenylalanyl-tRNA--protein transferase [Muribaculaceae bacterium]
MSEFERIVLGSEYKGWFDPRPVTEGAELFSEGSTIVAIGGDLSPERLYDAYKVGIFPWASYDTPFFIWHCPKERFVIFPEEIHVSHSMRTLINKGKYKVTFNKAFREVITNCSDVDGRIYLEGAWLGEEMIEAYTRLHDLGVAESVEVWNEDGALVGGLYGVVYNGCFMGESMFSLEPSGSKLALISLAHKMQAEEGKVIDCQFPTPHLASMGGRMIPYQEFLDMLHPDGRYGFIPVSEVEIQFF